MGLAKFKVQNGANPEKKEKQHDNADVTFRIVPTTYENWQASSELLFVVMGYAAVNLKLF